MVELKCKFCGKSFFAKRKNRKYCSKECSDRDHKGKPNVANLKEKIKVECAVCNKIEYVTLSRARKYLTCSTECQHVMLSKKFNLKIKCNCEICGKELYLKPYYYYNSKTHCCSRKCLAELKKKTFSGENNHLYGLRGELNPSFLNRNIFLKNGKNIDISVPANDYPESKKGRILLHRKLIYDNKNLFSNCFLINLVKLLLK